MLILYPGIAERERERERERKKERGLLLAARHCAALNKKSGINFERVWILLMLPLV